MALFKQLTSNIFQFSVILSAAKDLMPVASGDEIPSATLRAGFASLKDDR
jgi:hypothetical protein